MRTEAAPAPLSESERPTTLMRWIYSWPIIVFLIALAVLGRMGPQIHEYFQAASMDNSIFLLLPDTICAIPFLIPLVGFPLLWLHFTWVCRSKKRMEFVGILAFAALAGFIVWI